MNRGRHGVPVFDNDGDREHFLKLMQDCGRRWKLTPVAYCLMGNHYHILWLDEEGFLDRGMRHLDGVYTQAYNRRNGKDGTLFRGRYKARLVQEERYLAEVVRYLHFNPVDAGLVSHAADYPWSSHRAFLGLESSDWLRADLAFPYVPGVPQSPSEFDEFVHERADPDTHTRIASKRWSTLLGDADFVEAMRTRVRADSCLNHPEIPESRELAALDTDWVLEQVCADFGVPEEVLYASKRGMRNEARLLAILACREFTAAPARDIGNKFGVKPASLPSLVRSARTLIRNDALSRERWESLLARLVAVNAQSST
jgi:REP element-mobilizing transposase RayT